MANVMSQIDWTETGIYTVPEAARLIGTNSTRIRRWLEGYKFQVKDGQHSLKPVLKPLVPIIEGHIAIGFQDLVELLFVKSFRKFGVTLPTIRRAANEAVRRWRVSHPFSVMQLKTDGRSVFASIQPEEGDDQLIELTKSQFCFESVLNPYLRQLEYDGLSGDVRRWWPLGKTKPVFLDPRVAFGKPVIRPCNIPVESICQAVTTNESEEDVAKWYDIPLAAVRAALEFERTLAA